jgi:hypothetical protein
VSSAIAATETDSGKKASSGLNVDQESISIFHYLRRENLSLIMPVGLIVFLTQGNHEYINIEITIHNPVFMWIHDFLSSC